MFQSKSKKNLSKEGFYIMETHFLNKNVVKVREYLQHDGYDRHGPQSNLWDLKITTLENDKYYLNIYHWEEWYTIYDEHEYKLEKTIEITKEDYFKKD